MQTSQLTLLLALTFVIGADAIFNHPVSAFRRRRCNRNKAKSKCKIFNPENGKLEMKFRLDVQCDDGYAQSADDKTKIICIDGGQTLVPNCVRDCGELEAPVNGRVTYSSTVVDSVASYGCDTGFTLDTGDQQRTCQIDGNWSGVEPKCTNNVCSGNDVASEFGQVCCPLSCGGECGGSQCASFPAGPENCCEVNILQQNVSCSDSTAPCVLKPFPAEFSLLLDQFSQYQRLGEEIMGLKNGVIALRDEVNMIVPLRDEVGQLNAAVLVAQNDISTTKSELDVAKSDILIANNKITATATLAEEAKAESEQMKLELDAAKIDIAMAKEDSAAAKAEAASITSELTNVAAQLQAIGVRVSAAEGEIEALKAASGTGGDTSAITSDLEAVKLEVAAAKSSITDLDARVGGIDGVATTNTQNIQTLTNQTAHLANVQSDIEEALKQEFSVQSPYLPVTYAIALQGIYPSRNRRKRSITDPAVGQIMLFAGNFAPRGWALCEGQLLPVSQNRALFTILGTRFGGDGRSTFGLPDLRGRAAVHQGQGPGLTRRFLGAKGGAESHTIIP